MTLRSLAVSDIDSDAKVEIIAGSDNLYVLDDKGKTKWLYRSGGTEFKVAAVDLDSDGVDEIIIGGSDVAAYKGDGTPLWHCEVGHVYNLTTGFLCGNLVIAAGCANNSVCIISSSGDILWTHQFDEILFFYRACPMIADVDGDGINEVIIQSTDCRLFDASGMELWRFHRTIDGYGIDARCITTGNLNGLNGEEIILAGILRDKSGLWALNGEGDVLWVYQYPVTKVEETEHSWRGGYHEITSLATVDLNADGRDEIIGISDRKLYCFSSKGQLLWDIPLNLGGKELPTDTQFYRSVVKCFDLNGDGGKKIICGTNRLSVYDANGNEQWNAMCSGPVNDLAIADVNGDGYPEVIVASNELEIFSRDGVRLSNYMGIGKMDSIATGDVDGDGIPEIIAGGCGVYVLKMS